MLLAPLISPKFHTRLVMVPVEVSVNATVTGAMPAVGLARNDATGGAGGAGFTVIVIDAEAGTPPGDLEGCRTIPRHVNRTIPALFRRAVDDIPDRVWLVADAHSSTYAQAMQQIERAAGALRSAGVDRGDRALVTARNAPEYLLTWLALMEVGAVQVPVNPKSTRAELTGFVQQATPRCAVTDGELAPLVDAALGDAAVGATRIDVDELFAAPADGRGPTAVDERDVAVMIPTSGTTGRSKLVMQTHLAYVMAGEGFPYWLRLGRDDRLMTSLPLFHINAPAYSTLGSVAARASLALLPGFSARDFIAAARRHEATEFNAIGAMLEILMRQPARPDDADNPIRLCYTGPSPDRERQLEIEARFGFEIVCGYALSETPYGLVWRHGTRPYGSLARRGSIPISGTSTTSASWTTANASPPARSASSSSATRRSCAATTTCPRRPQRWSTTTVGCAPAISFATTATTPTRSSAARRRSSGAGARTCRRPRWRLRSNGTPTSPRRPSSASRRTCPSRT